MTDWKLLEEVHTCDSQRFTRRSTWFIGARDFRNKSTPNRYEDTCLIMERLH